MPRYQTTLIAPHHGALELAGMSLHQATVTRLRRKIHRYVSEEEIELQLATDP